MLLAAIALAADPALSMPDLSDPEVKLEIQVDVVTGLVEAKLHEAALQAIKELRDQGVTDERLDLLQARAMYGQGMRAEGRGQLDAYLKKHRRDADAWALLGVMLADDKQLPEAFEALQRANRLQPRDAAVLNNLGYVQMAMGRLDDAVATYRAALAADPTSVRARNNLGFALARQEKDDEALAAFRAAGDEADALYNLGLACELRDDRASAITHYKNAIAARPTHLEARAALGRLVSETPP
ncbi:MAG: tetratricopeptide repeat protein [Myxococcota bacterium]